MPSHWYTKEGETAYGATLREARKFQYRPSVTTIIAAAAAPALDVWKLRETRLAAFDNPPMPGESWEDYDKRLKELGDLKRAEAQEKGVAIHDGIDAKARGEEVDQQWFRHIDAAIRANTAFMGKEKVETEAVFSHPDGFGGKVDAHTTVNRGRVADYKCKDFDEDNLPRVYENHWQQLGAYRVGLGLPAAECAIHFVSTRVPGLVHTVVVPEDKVKRGEKQFFALLNYWMHSKNYYPGE